MYIHGAGAQPEIARGKRRGGGGLKEFGAILILLLAGCESEADKQQSAVPEKVKTMIAADFPADGQIHIQRRGKIRISSDTTVCHLDRDFWIGLYAPAGNSAATPDGRPQKSVAEPECKSDPKAVFIDGLKFKNRIGKPYKLVLAVWQGDAVWIGGVERIGGPRSDSYVGSLPVNDIPIFHGPTRAQREEKSKAEVSEYLDRKDLTAALVLHISGKIE